MRFECLVSCVCCVRGIGCQGEQFAPLIDFQLITSLLVVSNVISINCQLTFRACRVCACACACVYVPV